MKKNLTKFLRRTSALFILLMVLASASAQKIGFLTVRWDQTGEIKDIEQIEFLKTVGFDVTTIEYDKDVDYLAKWTAERVAELDGSYDLLISGRGMNSGAFSRPEDLAIWDSLKTPFIQNSIHAVRNNRCFWFNSTKIQEFIGPTYAKAAIKDDAIFGNVQLNESDEVKWFADGMVSNYLIDDTLSKNNGTVVLKVGENVPLIVRWDAYTEYYEGSGGKMAAGPRVYAGLGAEDPDVNHFPLSNVAKQVYLNEICRILDIDFKVAELEPEMFAGWTFDQVTGTTTVFDEKNISTGQVTNTVLDSLIVEGLVGDGLDFSGAADSVAVVVKATDMVELDSTESFTWSVLVSTSDITTGQDILFKGATAYDTATATGGKWYGMSFKEGNLRFAVDDNIEKSQIEYKDAADRLHLDGKWNHIAVVRDIERDSLFIYVNGEEVAAMTDATDGNIASPGLPLFIGNGPSGHSSFKGKLDEVKLYASALSAKQIADMADGFPVAKKLSTEARLSMIAIDGTDLDVFQMGVYEYEVDLEDNTTDIPVVSATLVDSRATMTLVQAMDVNGTAVINITAEDKTTTAQYKVKFNTIIDIQEEAVELFYNNGYLVSKGAKLAEVAIFDVTGRIVLDTKVNSDRTSLAELKDNQVYIVKATTEAGKVYTTRIVK